MWKKIIIYIVLLIGLLIVVDFASIYNQGKPLFFIDTVYSHKYADIIPLPKSKTEKRIAENIDVFDFSLDESDHKAIREMGIFGYSGFDPDNPDF